MKLSAPLYHLKRKAKLLSRAENIPLHEALDRVARQEGFSGWSLLAAKVTATAPAEKLFARLAPGDLVLVGARPGQGKTLMSLELAVQAMNPAVEACSLGWSIRKRICWIVSGPSAWSGRISSVCLNSIAPTT